MMDDLFLLLVYTGGLLAVLIVCAVLADYVLPWLERRL